MFGIFGFIFIIILIILIIALAIVGNIVAAVLRLFGLGRETGRRKQTYTRSDDQQYGSTSSSNDSNKAQSNPSEHKGKIIGDDEGEYVDFEEIK